MAQLFNTLPIGTLLRSSRNTYQIQKVLGQGTFGITYLATTQMQVAGALGAFETTITVAIKEFFMRDINGRENTQVSVGSQGGLFEDYRRKFIKEARNLGRLNHPNIVKVLEDFETNGTVYYVMEYIEGENLNEYLRRHPMSEEEACEVIKKVASAINYMHTEHNLLHLDLKPGNIMRRAKDGAIYLIDFGLSKSFADNGQPESSTSIGQGTMGYAPLEQTSYSKEKGNFLPTIDVYALGATLYKLLTCQTPPAASELLNDESLIVGELQRHQVRESIIEVVTHAMEPRVKTRIQSAQAFIDELCAADGRGQDEETVIGPDDEATSIETEKADVQTPPSDREAEKSIDQKPSSSSNTMKVAAIILAALLAIGGIVWMVLPSKGNAGDGISEAAATIEVVAPSAQEEGNNQQGVNQSQAPKPELTEEPAKQEKEPEKAPKQNLQEETVVKNEKKEASTAKPAQAEQTMAVEEEPVAEEVQTVDEQPVAAAASAASAVQQPQEDLENNVYDVVEQMAQFPGGEAACVKWLTNYMKYPAIAEEQGISGRVLVSFVVNKDGSISDAKVTRSPDPSLSKEALRLVNSMPRWTPARQNGKVVRSSYRLPITFRLR